MLRIIILGLLNVVDYRKNKIINKDKDCYKNRSITYKIKLGRNHLIWYETVIVLPNV